MRNSINIPQSFLIEYQGGRKATQSGYLLIELMIAIVLISCMGLIMAKIRAYSSYWHHQAACYLKAVSRADTIISGDQMLDDSECVSSLHRIRPYEEIPFIITRVSFTIPCGNEKKTITFTGGSIVHEAL